MTTIAANKEMMVSDSRVSVEHKGFNYPAIKIVKSGRSIIGAAGDAGDCTRFLKWAAGGFKAEPKWSTTTTACTEDSVVGLILNPDGIYIWTYGDPEPERIEAPFFAIGSGGKAARAAMMMGASVEEAVKIACEVDPGSGLPLQVFKLD